MICGVFRRSEGGKKSRLYTGQLRLQGWPSVRRFPLETSDKVVALRRIEELRQRFEREEAGLAVPLALTVAAQKPIAAHLADFLADLKAKGRAANTITKYQSAIGNLCERCGWTNLRDITLDHFSAWRRGVSLKPKTLNDILTCTRTFINWLERQQRIETNPLRHAEKVANIKEVQYRRSVTNEEFQRLLDRTKPHRRTVYLTAAFTGLRRNELNNLKWDDFDFEAGIVSVPATIAKNRKSSLHKLTPELVAALKAERPADAKPNDFVFRGRVPRVPVFKRDLERADIPFVDARGRRFDVHALRVQFGSYVDGSGVTVHQHKTLMRHASLDLSLGTYADIEKVKAADALKLPTFRLGTASAGTVKPAQGTAQKVYATVRPESHADAVCRESTLMQPVDAVASGRKKTAGVGTSRLNQNGAGEETRTLDVYLGKVVLYQLSYARKSEGG